MPSYDPQYWPGGENPRSASAAMNRREKRVGDAFDTVDSSMEALASRLEALESAPPGEGGSRKFVQSMPASTWTIDYETLLPPAVTVVVNGDKTSADVRFLETDKQILINFFAPTAGVAYLT